MLGSAFAGEAPSIIRRLSGHSQAIHRGAWLTPAAIDISLSFSLSVLPCYCAGQTAYRYYQIRWSSLLNWRHTEYFSAHLHPVNALLLRIHPLHAARLNPLPPYCYLLLYCLSICCLPLIDCCCALSLILLFCFPVKSPLQGLSITLVFLLRRFLPCLFCKPGRGKPHPKQQKKSCRY